MGAGTPSNRLRRQAATYGAQQTPSSSSGPSPSGPVTPPIGMPPRLGGATQPSAGPVVIPGGNSACRNFFHNQIFLKMKSYHRMQIGEHLPTWYVCLFFLYMTYN